MAAMWATYLCVQNKLVSYVLFVYVISEKTMVTCPRVKYNLLLFLRNCLVVFDSV